MDKSMEKPANSGIIWHHQIGLVRSNPWHNSNASTTSCNKPCSKHDVCNLQRNWHTDKLINWQTDTLAHRISKCNEGPVIWNWTKARMAAILRLHPSTIPEDWALLLTYKFWLAKKYTAITWMLAHFVCYRLQTHRRQSLKDYLDFLRRARWKVYHHPRRSCKVGRYLDVL